MFVLTVDQVDSRRSDEDAVAPILAARDDWRERGAVLGPDRTAGDEFQLLYATAAPALDAALRLHRTGLWSIGIGVGAVVVPLPSSTGAGRGDAFVSARAAVESAKRSPNRLAVAAADTRAARGDGALIGLLLEVRSRRTPEGWEVADLVEEGLSQAAIAERLGVTPQAISLRVRAAAVRLERDAVPALEQVLAELDVPG
ncbi:DNA-binding protein [Amnibacterium sp.]|uniref:DNA-binding protein n=1 Tax=Amnibacterium sp. TaxID=1872496 RepID=UPI003F7C4821